MSANGVDISICRTAGCSNPGRIEDEGRSLICVECAGTNRRTTDTKASEEHTQ